MGFIRRLINNIKQDSKIIININISGIDEKGRQNLHFTAEGKQLCFTHHRVLVVKLWFITRIFKYESRSTLILIISAS